VVPKAASYAQPGRADPEDEKTTIESGWEDEASTTVEQGEVAEKIRALAPVLEARRKEAAAPDSADTPLRKGGTGITSTNGSIISDELTVDDQRANAVISMIMPPSNGRLVVTMGNDKDTELEVRPGKSYTIGRGLDNDIVLTDIAVSRKHFDLRHEAGAWVLVDRGSGNGTLVNGVFEDQPFVLANGDTIEIGNTSFRFDMQGARLAPEPARPSATAGLDVNFDEENEPSTVAGKVPIRGEDIPTPVIVSKSAAVPAQRPRTERPKTAPPPPPLPRPRTQSNAPSMSAVYSAQHAVPSVPVGPSAVMASMSAPMGPMSVSMTPPTAGMPASTMPLPQMAGRMPMGHGSGMGPAVEPLVIGSPPLNTTLPGQGMHQYQPNGLAPHGAALAPTLIPPPGTPMGALPPAPMSQPYDYYGNGTNGGGYGAPPPGSNPMFQQPPPNGNGQGMWGQPHHMAPMGNQSGIEIAPGMLGRDATTTGLVPPGAYAPLAYGTPHQGTPTLSRRAKLMLGGALLSVVAALATVAIIKGTSKSKDSTATVETKDDAKPVAKDGSKKSDKPQVTPPTKPQPQTAVTPTKTTPPTKPTPAVTAPVATPPGKPTPPTVATTPAIPKPATPPVATPPPVKPTPTTTPTVKPPVTVAVAPPPDKPGKETKAEKKRREKAEQEEKARIAKEKRDKERKERKEREKKEQAAQVAIELKPIDETPSTSTAGAKEKAEELYKKKKFSEAAAAIKSAAKSDASLKKLFTAYEQVANAYKTGMASGAKPVDAYRSLKRARSFDATAGGYHEVEINTKLRDVAPRAAVTFLGSKDYAESYGAMNLAESIGVKSDSLKLVRNKLEAAAGQLYGEAESLMASDPDEAKKKLRVIKTMVSADSQWSAKATKLLRS